jgi:hypothetical protein
MSYTSPSGRKFLHIRVLAWIAQLLLLTHTYKSQCIMVSCKHDWSIFDCICFVGFRCLARCGIKIESLAQLRLDYRLPSQPNNEAQKQSRTYRDASMHHEFSHSVHAMHELRFVLAVLPYQSTQILNFQPVQTFCASHWQAQILSRSSIIACDRLLDNGGTRVYCVTD